MFAGAWSIDWGAIAAAISIGIIPSIIFILFARKFLIKGLTMGAVKE
jgi:multiple sugar transport system permease protein